jgi:hypothetical protein
MADGFSFSSHFSRTLITDLHHNHCEDISTVHHRELRQSPETNAFSGRKLFTALLTKYGQNMAGRHPRKSTPNGRIRR